MRLCVGVPSQWCHRCVQRYANEMLQLARPTSLVGGLSRCLRRGVETLRSGPASKPCGNGMSNNSWAAAAKSAAAAAAATATAASLAS